MINKTKIIELNGYKFKIKKYRALTIHRKIKEAQDILRQYPYHIDVIYD